MRVFFLFCGLLCATLTTFAKDIPVAAFSRNYEFSSMKVSPEGSNIAVMMKKDGKDILIIHDRATFEITYVLFFEDNAQVGRYEWVNDERVVVQKEYLRGFTAEPLYYGEIFTVNADGSKARYIMGQQGEDRYNSRIKKREKFDGIAYILDPLIQDDKHILVEAYKRQANSGFTSTFADVFKVNIYNGKRDRVTRVPAENPSYLTDYLGNIRFAEGTKDYVTTEVFKYDIDEDSWSNVDLSGFTSISLVSSSADGNILYANASKDNSPSALYAFDVVNNTQTKLSSHERVSPMNIWQDSHDNIYAVAYDSGEISYDFIDEASSTSARVKGLIDALPGHEIHMISSSLDNNFQIIKASNNKNPGDYYLFDATKNNLQYLRSAARWLDPADMASVKPLTVPTRDGVILDAYLTIPKGKEAKNLPLVVMPHGGPFGVRDYNQFDSQAQLLANRGIAVLQVNFRGSGGYGLAFKTSRYGDWAGIQNDIIDSVQYTIEQGMVDKNNICIVGASFGGYSAMQSAVMAPDLFKCAVGIMGVYNLPMMFSEGDVQETQAGMRNLEITVGTDPVKLKAMSPSYHADKIKAEILLIHGEDDDRAPLEQAESMQSSLKKAGKNVEFLLLEDEGHGVFKDENREVYFTRVVTFLQQHLQLDNQASSQQQSSASDE